MILPHLVGEGEAEAICKYSIRLIFLVVNMARREFCQKGVISPQLRGFRLGDRLFGSSFTIILPRKGGVRWTI